MRGEWILEKWGGKCGQGSTGSGYGPVATNLRVRQKFSRDAISFSTNNSAPWNFLELIMPYTTNKVQRTYRQIQHSGLQIRM